MINRQNFINLKEAKNSRTEKKVCNASIASKTIMLHRIFDGNKLEFPFL